MDTTCDIFRIHLSIKIGDILNINNDYYRIISDNVNIENINCYPVIYEKSYLVLKYTNESQFNNKYLSMNFDSFNMFDILKLYNSNTCSYIKIYKCYEQCFCSPRFTFNVPLKKNSLYIDIKKCCGNDRYEIYDNSNHIKLIKPNKYYYMPPY